MKSSLLYFILLFCFISSCKSDNTSKINITNSINGNSSWEIVQEFDLPDMTPNSISILRSLRFVSDTVQQKVFLCDSSFNILETILTGKILDLNQRKATLIMPLANKDSIFAYNGKPDLYKFDLPVTLNRPVSFDGTSNENFALVDQGNNRVLFNVNRKLKLYGQYGSEIGKFDKPIAVEFVSGQYFVVESGNSRVQIFSEQGSFLSSFGEEYLEEPTSITSDGEYIFISDKSKNEVLVFDKVGEYIESIKEGFVNPLSVFYANSLLYVANKSEKEIMVFKRK